MFELTVDQEVAIRKVKDWYKNPNKNPVFIVEGSAGTGKTTMLNYIIKELNIENKVAAAAFTGKAALVLSNKIGFQGTTIHRLIYECRKDPKDVSKVRFVLRHRNELSHLKMIVIDESSMLSTKLFEDLLTFNIPIIFVGDQNQLPPIGETTSLFSVANVKLNEITRFAKENPVVYLSQQIIKNKRIKYGQYGNNVSVVNRDFINRNKGILLKADQVLCGTNKMRNDINRTMRDLKNIKDIFPVEGDKIICRKNNWNRFIEEQSAFLLNGLIGTISSPIEKKLHNYWNPKLGRAHFDDVFEYDFTDVGGAVFKDIKCDYDNLVNGSNLYRQIHAEKTVDVFNYGYCITIHSSQGSEWDNVILYGDELFGDEENKKKLLYTGLTRAKNKLILVL